MSEKTRFIDARRRGFLKNGAAAAGVVAAGTAIAGHQSEQPPAADVSAPPPAARPGYRLTDHVREYYAKARF